MMTTYLTSVASSFAWVTDPLDPGGASVTCGTRRPSDATHVQDGEVRQFVGRRTQLVPYDTYQETLPLTFGGVTDAQRQQLVDWIGRTLLVRTSDGLRYYGGYLSTSEKVYLLAGPLYDVSCTLSVVSFTDET